MEQFKGGLHIQTLGLTFELTLNAPSIMIVCWSVIPVKKDLSAWHCCLSRLSALLLRLWIMYKLHWHNIFSKFPSLSVSMTILDYWTLPCTTVLFTEPESSWSDHSMITDLTGVIQNCSNRIFRNGFHRSWCKWVPIGYCLANQKTIHTSEIS